MGRGSGAGTTKASLASGVTLQAFGLDLADQTVGVLDLSDVGQRLLGHPLPFILGREIFDNARLEIDIEGRTIRVLDASTEPRGTRLDLRTAHGIETMPVLVEGRPAQALFDIGNGTRPLIGGGFADAAGMLADGRAIHEEAGGGIGGAVTRQIITLKSVELAGKKFENVETSIDRAEHAHEFNVGVSILRHYLITTDFRQRKVWLAPRE